ncbi:unnamed protein product [Peronospora destructor]|uniref:Uncharacterized protein n=1 Tax=Peronospora destructor TaxID=86335 RepID=A0AAV0TJS9_9STRA|nr:unnamed protein product [Peronospora destructor]
MKALTTLWTWMTFTTVSSFVFSAYMTIMDRNLYKIMFPTSPIHSGTFKSLVFNWESSNFRHLDLNISYSMLAQLADESETVNQVWDALKSNASVFLHVHVTHAGFSPNMKDSKIYDQYRTIHQVSSLIKYAARPNAKNASLLLASSEAPSGSPTTHWETSTISYWKPAANVQLVTDFTRYPVEEIPMMVYHNLRYVQHPMDQRWRYLPALYVDDLSLMQDELVPLNATLDNGSGGEVVLPLRLSWSPLSFARWQMQLTFTTVLLSQEQMGVPSSDLDALRSMVTDTHPVLLAVMMSVSLLHLLFDWLAFRHDVSYWRTKGDNVVGVSLRAMAAELGSQCVVLLYLFDQDSTLLVTIPQFISVVLLVWKVTKVWRAQRKIQSTAAFGVVKDSAKVMDKHSLRLLEETQRADSLATSHMFFVLAPLAAGYAVYSLIYVPTLDGTPGCSSLSPRRFTGWWRLLVYRALNTFIDDLFAFVIKMPTLHRISCFRDDIVFIVYLYQRWIYPVDVQRFEDVADGASASEDASNKPHNE